VRETAQQTRRPVRSAVQGTRVRVWTIQTAEVLHALQAGAVWRARESSVDPEMRAPCRWMARELSQRVEPPSQHDQVPVWVWCQWRGELRRRPDLRAHGHLPPGVAGVRLELDVDASRLLPSDFELWHYALNGWYLPASRGDERAFEARPDPARVAPSWQRIFDLAWSNRRYTVPAAQKSIQAVLWELRPADLRAVTSFRSPGRIGASVGRQGSSRSNSSEGASPGRK
jgi:hypothetical protein